MFHLLCPGQRVQQTRRMHESKHLPNNPEPFSCTHWLTLYDQTRPDQRRQDTKTLVVGPLKLWASTLVLRWVIHFVPCSTGKILRQTGTKSRLCCSNKPVSNTNRFCVRIFYCMKRFRLRPNSMFQISPYSATGTQMTDFPFLVQRVRWKDKRNKSQIFEYLSSLQPPHRSRNSLSSSPDRSESKSKNSELP